MPEVCGRGQSTVSVLVAIMESTLLISLVVNLIDFLKVKKHRQILMQ